MARALYDILKSTVELHSWQIPEPVLKYTANILTDRLDQANWQPEPSYAECYMQLRTAAAARAFGDLCFFTRAVFPEVMERRGLKSSYFVDLGQSAYTMALTASDLAHIRMIRDHFEFLAEVVYTAMRMNGDFRSMWE